MKHILSYLLLLLPMAGFAGHLSEFDTIKTLTDNALAANPVVEELRLALINLRLAEKEKRPESMLVASLQIANIYNRERFFSKAVDYYRQSELLAEQAGDEVSALSCQWLAASALLDGGQPARAHEAFLKLLDQHAKSGRYEPQVKTLEKLAQASLATSDFARANDYYLKIKGLAEAKHDPVTLATALNNLGFAANRRQDFKSAVEYFTQAEAVYRENPAVKSGYVYTNLGIAWNNLGESVQSLQNLQRADNGLEDKSYVQHLIASIYLKNNDIYNALQYNELAINSARKTANVQVQCDAYESASQIYQQLFEYDKAFDFYKKHLTLKDSLLRGERQRQLDLENLHNLLEQAETETLQGFTEEELRNLTMERLKTEAERLQLLTDNQSLEADRKEKQVALLLREQEAKEANLRTAQLEAERNRQELNIATQQLLAAEQGREITNLSQQNQLDSLEAARQQAEQQRQIAGLENEKQLTEMQLQQQAEFRKSAYRLGGLLGLILLVIFGSWLYGRRLNRRLAHQNRQIEAQKQEIDTERSRAEGLLLNILPGQVAQELKTKGSATPQHYDSVTMMFTDFQGFTKISATMPPAEVVSELNECFLVFDEIAERHRLEKIKTIGDSYMCAGGLPVENTTHPTDAIAAALEILDFINQRNQGLAARGKPEWQIRIGIHTGEVVAGVVGSRKFAYDVWGDTVNVASRMESNCPADNINISEETWRLVNQTFNCEYRGELEVKNKGKMGMYLVSSAG